MADPRERSRSPPRKPKSSSSGFRWKDKSKDSSSANSSHNSDRGYRARSPRRDRSSRRDGRDGRDGRDRDGGYSRGEDRDRRGDGGDNYWPRNRDSDRNRGPGGDRDSYRSSGGGRDRSPRRDNRGRPRSPRRDDKKREERKEDKEKYKDKAKPPPRPAAPISTEQMIIVNVNDRLGTKAAIPCLASDPVKAFKAMVAARIGRQPHEIMLKRQGERPFKDQLTLEDYGVSNGVQLDLELDTGD